MNRCIFALFSVSLLFLSIGCGKDTSPDGDSNTTATGEKPDKRTSTSAPPDGLPDTKKYDPYFSQVCQFKYPAGQSAKYVQMIDDFLVKYPIGGVGGPQKIALLEKYKELFTNNYDADIKGSLMQIFQGKPVNDNAILATMIPAWGGSPVNLEIRQTKYTYEKNKAFVDFANARIGGGTLGLGFVQEEIEMFESTFLPWLSQVPKLDPTKTSVDWCEGISLRTLDKTPVVMKFRMPFTWNSPLYGRSFSAELDFDKIRQGLILGHRDTDIYSIALAATSFSRGRGNTPRKYSRADLNTMTLAATRGFLDAMRAMHADGVPIEIHTGNWGAGVFFGNTRVAWTMQALAVLAAYEIFKTSVANPPQVRLVYNAFDAANNNKAGQGLARLQGMAAAQTLDQHLTGLLAYINANQATWQTGK